jgi:hypothetical protein
MQFAVERFSHTLAEPPITPMTNFLRQSKSENPHLKERQLKEIIWNIGLF